MENEMRQNNVNGHYTDANSKIRIITQKQRKYRFIRFKSGRRYSMHYAGCGLFSLAHAIQWLTNNKLADDAEEINLVKKLLNYKINTFHNLTYAIQIVEANYPEILYHQGALNKKTLTADLVRSIFDDGGVIIAIPKVHYVLAVGYRYYNNTMYVQIVDSCPYSTIEPREKHELHIGYAFDSFEEIKTQFSGGAQYWIPWECFSGQCKHTERRFGDWWWLAKKSSQT